MTHQSPILHTIARFALPFSLLVAVRVFLQGHDLPGGGFIAGALLAAAGAMYLMAFGLRRARGVAWWRLAVAGLGISIATGTVPLLRGQAFMDHHVLHLGAVHMPTATVFDLGVLLIVFGTLMTIFVELGLERR